MKSNDNSEECDGFAMNCFLCPRIFTDIDELQEHLSVHSLEPPSQNTTSQQNFNCNVCERSLRSEKELNKHYKYYHESNMLRKANEANQRFECKYCENIYLSQKSLQLHMDSHHGTKIERAKRAKHSDKLYVAIQLVERKQKYPPRSPYFNP
ncbi:hypothetical protein KR215_001205 [Drosophila sulfurigaster]|nr:hypothetical protein KR215_001205 [Drosophila sulfurigaster]